MEPIRVVAAVLEQDGKYLGCRRAPGKSLAGLWEFPGGKVEPGETDEEALVREVAEELSVSIIVHEFVAESRGAVHEKDIVLRAFRCSLMDEKPSSSNDHDMLRWFTHQDFIHEEWASADIPILVSLSSMK